MINWILAYITVGLIFDAIGYYSCHKRNISIGLETHALFVLIWPIIFFTMVEELIRDH